jgi:F-type H+-transporting ATPase subunit gamma
LLPFVVAVLHHQQNTMKITEAMKLVAAAKVRRAQEAVVNGRPFAENLIKVRLCLN